MARSLLYLAGILQKMLLTLYSVLVYLIESSWINWLSCSSTWSLNASFASYELIFVVAVYVVRTSQSAFFAGTVKVTCLAPLDWMPPWPRHAKGGENLQGCRDGKGWKMMSGVQKSEKCQAIKREATWRGSHLARLFVMRVWRLTSCLCFSFLFRLAFEDCQADFVRRLSLSPSPSSSSSTGLLWEAILFPVSWVPHTSPSQPETFKLQIATVDLLLISTLYIPRIEAKGKRRTVNGKARQVARSLRNLPRLCDYYLLASQSDEEAKFLCPFRAAVSFLFVSLPQVGELKFT